MKVKTIRCHVKKSCFDWNRNLIYRENWLIFQLKYFNFIIDRTWSCLICHESYQLEVNSINWKLITFIDRPMNFRHISPSSTVTGTQKKNRSAKNLSFVSTTSTTCLLVPIINFVAQHYIRRLSRFVGKKNIFLCFLWSFACFIFSMEKLPVLLFLSLSSPNPEDTVQLELINNPSNHNLWDEVEVVVILVCSTKQNIYAEWKRRSHLDDFPIFTVTKINVPCKKMKRLIIWPMPK